MRTHAHRLDSESIYIIYKRWMFSKYAFFLNHFNSFPNFMNARLLHVFSESATDTCLNSFLVPELISWHAIDITECVIVQVSCEELTTNPASFRLLHCWLLDLMSAWSRFDFVLVFDSIFDMHPSRLGCDVNAFRNFVSQLCFYYLFSIIIFKTIWNHF